MTPTKPATRPIAKAIEHPTGRGIAAQYALPGVVPAFVLDPNGKPKRFMSEFNARIEALDALVLLIEERSRQKRHLAHGLPTITGKNLAELLAEADITADDFANLGGWSVSRVQMWLNGDADVPHAAHVLAYLLGYEENYEDALALAKQRLPEGELHGCQE